MLLTILLVWCSTAILLAPIVGRVLRHARRAQAAAEPSVGRMRIVDAA